MLLFNLAPYFNGEISIPNLPTARAQEDFAFYGSALMTQTAGENNLVTFVNTKATEYFINMFGSPMTDDLLREWHDYSTETEKTETALLTISDEVLRNTWLEYTTELDIDLLFADYKIDGYEKTEDRFGNVKIFSFTKETYKIRLRIVSNEQNKIFVNVNNATVLSTPIEVIDVRSLATISKPFRTLLNLLFTNQGTTKVSPVANYVYYWLNRDAANGTTAMGESDLNFSRASSAYEADKHIKLNAIRNRLIRSWNGMVLLNRTVLTYLYNNVSDYDTYSIPTSQHRNLTTNQNTFNA